MPVTVTLEPCAVSCTRPWSGGSVTSMPARVVSTVSASLGTSTCTVIKPVVLSICAAPVIRSTHSAEVPPFSSSSSSAGMRTTRTPAPSTRTTPAASSSVAGWSELTSTSSRLSPTT